jgi:hypothetical protein
MRRVLSVLMLCCALASPVAMNATTVTGSGSCTSTSCSGSFSAGNYSGSGTVSQSGGSLSVYYLTTLIFQITWSVMFH